MWCVSIPFISHSGSLRQHKLDFYFAFCLGDVAKVTFPPYLPPTLRYDKFYALGLQRLLSTNSCLFNNEVEMIRGKKFYIHTNYMFDVFYGNHTERWKTISWFSYSTSWFGTISLSWHWKCREILWYLREHFGWRHLFPLCYKKHIFKYISWTKMHTFLFRFHWSLFLRAQLTIFMHWLR